MRKLTIDELFLLISLKKSGSISVISNEYKPLIHLGLVSNYSTKHLLTDKGKKLIEKMRLLN